MRLSEVAPVSNPGVHLDKGPNIDGSGAIPHDPHVAGIDRRRASLNRRTAVGKVEVTSRVMETGSCSAGDASPALVSGQGHGLPHR